MSGLEKLRLTSTLPRLARGGSVVAGPSHESVVQAFADQVYGRTPGGGGTRQIRVVLEHDDEIRGVRTRELAVEVGGDRDVMEFRALLFLPTRRDGEIPVFIGLNFDGNHSVTTLPDVARSTIHSRRSSPVDRGADQASWDIVQTCRAGFAVLTAHYEGIEPDAPDSPGGVRSLFGTQGAAPWGAIGAWAWGLSRLADVAEQHDELGRIVGFGHSRLGKTALWAGVQDERFAAVISHQSGLFGASLLRHPAGEDLAAMLRAFPHWLTPGISAFLGRSDDIPVDQHQLLALLAPRGALVTSGLEDHWCDPAGEYLGVQAAAPAHYGVEAATTGVFPADPVLGRTYGDRLAYRLRPGGHHVSSEDWGVFRSYARRALNIE